QEASERNLRTIADSLPVLISYIDANQRVRFLNATFRSWMGTDPDEALGRPFVDVVGRVLYEQRVHALKGALAGVRQRFETRSEANGIYRDLLTEYVPDIRDDGTVAGVYTLATDVTAFKQVERELDQLSRIDPLTGLPNRRQFDQRLSEALARARRSGRAAALMFLDLDHFKQINDNLGHSAGDMVLKVFAERLRACLRETDQVCRLAGDEFVLILENLHQAADATAVAEKILAAVRAPLELSGTSLTLSTSIGIATYAGRTESDEAGESALLDQADDALYAAKAAGRGCWRLAP
ncbi:MAG: GGDEF domain-containing protein, partial [Burkholderiaceae bacterium]